MAKNKPKWDTARWQGMPGGGKASKPSASGVMGYNTTRRSEPAKGTKTTATTANTVSQTKRTAGGSSGYKAPAASAAKQGVQVSASLKKTGLYAGGEKEPLWRRTPGGFGTQQGIRQSNVPKEEYASNMERIANKVLNGGMLGGVKTVTADAKKDYISQKTKEFQKNTNRYVDDLFSGKVKASKGMTGSADPGDKFRYTDGDLADPFTQGLFGEKDLRNEFVRRQTEIFQPKLEEMAKKITEKNEPKKSTDFKIKTGYRV